MKGSWNSMSIIPITLSLFFVFIYNFEEILGVHAGPLCLSDQRDVLLQFKNEFEIDETYQSCIPKTKSWTNNSDCCSWEGITCNTKSGEVMGLNLSHSCLSGQFPSSIGNLSHLTYLDLSQNHFNGPIPSSVGNLYELTSLDLSYNRFTGQIPFSIENLSQLTSLHLEGNNFVGPIPRSISKLTNLLLLDFSHFNLQAPVDFSIFSHLKSLQSLVMSNLNTTTTIALNDILSYFKNLTTLDLSGNHVSVANKNSVSDPPLQSIQELTLSGCGITELPEIIRTQKYMRRLDTSNNNIKGQVPGWLWTLPKLVYVNLSNNTFTGFENPTKDGFSSAPKSAIQYLSVSNNNFTGKIPSFICGLRSLMVLDLSNNNFNGSILHCMGNLNHNVSVLNLRHNSLHGSLPKTIFKSLRSFDVGHNQLVGKLPRSLIHFSALEFLNVESNRINDTFPFWLSSLQKLQILVLRSNAFHGPIHQASFPKLQIINISYNHFNGTLSSDFFVKWSAMSSFGTNEDDAYEQYMGDGYYHDSMVLMNKGVEMTLVRILKIFTALDFSGNKLEGEIPMSIGLLKGLLVLNLSNNAFTGHIPSSIGNLTALESLDVSQNQLSLSNLAMFIASGNASSGTLPSSLFTIPYLTYINLSNNQLTELPEFIRIQKQSWQLDISNNNIKGQVPGWLWTLPELQYVNLSNNTFTGFENPTKDGFSSAPKSAIQYLFGSNNNLSGKIPSFICGLGSLEILDLSNNNFSGSIPPCMGNPNRNLSVLNLRHNRLQGSLPKNIFKRLRSLDVGHNQLVGKLPRSLIHFSTLEVLNVESNRINDTFPFWLSSLQELQILVLRSNAFHGPIHQALFQKLKIIDISYNQFSGTLPSDYFVKWSAMSSLGTNENQSEYMGDIYYHDSMVLMNKGTEMELVRILKIYTALDFSGNKLEGEIPRSIGMVKELRVLNLSNNAFTGHIPPSMGNLTVLESLDVSQNQLSGEIPQELGSLSFLAYMNFSDNQLSGLVPGGTQFRRQPCSSFEGNTRRLFGPALDEVCEDIHTPTSEHSKRPEPEEEDEDEEVVSWIAAAIGFIPGISFGITLGYIFVSSKTEWFMNFFARNKRRSRNTTIQ